jgi:glycine dehydrogenase subunit 1
VYSYIPHTKEDIDRMLKKIGVSSVDELFADIDPGIALQDGLNLAKGMAEQDVYLGGRALADKNHILSCFAGAGSYDHYIPAAVEQILAHPEFTTAYTPYQAEISQGVLQAIFEYQSYMCRLTGMDVSNASLYDGATAAAEACSIAFQVKRKADTVLVSDTVHPYTIRVIKTYFQGLDVKIKTISSLNGCTSADSLNEQLNGSIAAVVLQTPNFNGIIEDLEGIADQVHANNSLFLLSVNPLSLGCLKSPAEWGADIAFGEAQSLGLPMNFGGPGVGFLAARKEFMRKIPGRIAGETLDRDGRKAYVLTLQAREQHIKRERATSNICTNQALAALGVAAFLAMTGEAGLNRLARENINGFDYFRKKLTAATPVTEKYSGPYFNEAVFEVPRTDEFRKFMTGRGFLPGVRLDNNNYGLEGDSGLVLFTVTEKRTKSEIDAFIIEAGSFYK